MKIQKYVVWPVDLTDCSDEAETFQSSSPEAAAEYYVEDNWDGFEGLQTFNVAAEDGTVYEVCVEIETRPSARARRN